MEPSKTSQPVLASTSVRWISCFWSLTFSDQDPFIRMSQQVVIWAPLVKVTLTLRLTQLLLLQALHLTKTTSLKFCTTTLDGAHGFTWCYRVPIDDVIMGNVEKITNTVIPTAIDSIWSVASTTISNIVAHVFIMLTYLHTQAVFSITTQKPM